MEKPKKRKKVILIILLLLTVGVVGYFFLPDEFRPGKHNEGLITYDVSYPYYDGSMGNIMPSEMTLYFKDDVYASELSSGGFFMNKFLVDNKKKTLTHQVKTIGTKAICYVNEQSIENMLGEFPDFDIIYTEQSDSVAGFLCKKAIAIFHDVSHPDMVIYYTDAKAVSGMNNSNWCNQFREIPGVLLQYEIQQFGLRTRFTARSFEKIEVPEGALDVEEGFTEVGVEDMLAIMKLLFENIL